MTVYGVFLTIVSRTVVRDRQVGEASVSEAGGESVELEQEGAPVAEVLPAVVIDAGHGGKDGGTVQNGVIEKNGTLAISLLLRDELARRGIPVVMTREDDETLELLERSRMANQVERLLLVSIHLNSGPGEVQGVETFFSEPKSLEAQRVTRAGFRAMPGDKLSDGRGVGLAEQVQAGVCATTGARNRGVKNRPSLSVTRHTHCPAVLVECGFLTNAEEARNLKTGAYQAQVARGIANGVEAYLEGLEADPAYGIVFERKGERGATEPLSAGR